MKSIEDLQDINRQIVKLGEQFNKLVVATCDVHFLDPEDEVYRRIIMAGKGFKDADDQAPLYPSYHGGDAGRVLSISEVIRRKRSSLQYRTRLPICVRRSHRCARTSVRRSLRIPIRCCVRSATTERMRFTARICRQS